MTSSVAPAADLMARGFTVRDLDDPAALRAAVYDWFTDTPEAQLAFVLFTFVLIAAVLWERWERRSLDEPADSVSTEWFWRGLRSRDDLKQRPVRGRVTYSVELPREETSPARESISLT